MSDSSTTQTWSALAEAPLAERVSAMAEAFRSIATLDDEARVGNIAALLDEESSLDDKGLQAMAAGRLRALAEIDVLAAHKLVAAFDQAERKLPGAAGMRRVFAVQAAAKGLDLDEIARIEQVMPSVREMAGLAPARPDRPIAAGDLIVEAAPPRKGLFARLFSRS